jgi:hypothetical protein
MPHMPTQFCMDAMAQREGVTFDGKSYQVVWEILGDEQSVSHFG